MDQPELSRHCIPWTPFKGALTDATVCIVSSAGVRKKSDPPFHTDGDNTFRVIDGPGSSLAYDDSHYDHACADQDINCIFPIDRLSDLEADGLIKGATAKHFSYGFSMKLRELREETFPKLLKEVEAARPDIVVLTGG
jgi:D-proline reductase (dithiol) PrdB